MQEEDPRRRNNFTLGLQEEISVRVVPKYRRFEKELKIAGDTGKKKNAIWALLLSLLVLIRTFQQNCHNNLLVVSPDEMYGHYCLD